MTHRTMLLKIVPYPKIDDSRSLEQEKDHVDTSLEVGLSQTWSSPD